MENLSLAFMDPQAKNMFSISVVEYKDRIEASLNTTFDLKACSDTYDKAIKRLMEKMSMVNDRIKSMKSDEEKIDRKPADIVREIYKPDNDPENS